MEGMASTGKNSESAVITMVTTQHRARAASCPEALLKSSMTGGKARFLLQMLGDVERRLLFFFGAGRPGSYLLGQIRDVVYGFRHAFCLSLVVFPVSCKHTRFKYTLFAGRSQVIAQKSICRRSL